MLRLLLPSSSLLASTAGNIWHDGNLIVNSEQHAREVECLFTKFNKKLKVPPTKFQACRYVNANVGFVMDSQCSTAKVPELKGVYSNKS